MQDPATPGACLDMVLQAMWSAAKVHRAHTATCWLGIAFLQAHPMCHPTNPDTCWKVGLQETCRSAMNIHKVTCLPHTEL